MRRVVKRTLETVLSRSGVAAAGRAIGRRNAIVLAYHNVVPSDDPPMGDTSLHLPAHEFRAQLDLLERHFEVVPLPRLLSGGSGTDRPRVTITFDDAYRGSLEIGIPELLGRGLSATVFVPPGLLGGVGFWWDLLSEEGSGGLLPEIRSFALDDLGGRQDDILQWASSVGRERRTLLPFYMPASEEEVLAVADRPGVYLGSHTWSHVNLSSLSTDEAGPELRRSLAWLGDAAASMKVISYPYGAWDPHLGPSILDAGYEFGFLIRGGGIALSAIHAKPLSVPRMNIPRGLSREGFLARVSGVWPL